MIASILRDAKPPSRSFFCCDDDQADALASRLRDFYATTVDYVAFNSPSNQTLLWSHLAAALQERLRAAPDHKLHVLEAGAGRSGLAGYLQSLGLRDRVELCAQDVTAQNKAWLEESFDSVAIGPLEDVPGQFDFVIGSYVFEHVTAPRAFLDSLWSRVAPRGVIMTTCPRYDAPFYLPPSVDHLPAHEKLVLACYVAWRRVVTLVTGRPAWLVLKDPAVFYLPFSIDRDAVHWVSWFDIRAHWPRAERLPLASGGISDWVAKNLLTIGFRLVKEDAISPLS